MENVEKFKKRPSQKHYPDNIFFIEITIRFDDQKKSFGGGKKRKTHTHTQPGKTDTFLIAFYLKNPKKIGYY